MTTLAPAPRPSDLDALFARASRARVLLGGAVGGKALGKEVVLAFGREDLDALREALRVVEDAPPFHCMCRGDFAIELRGRFFRVATLSYHHGRSIRLDDRHWDADLVDGPAFLRLLAAKGVGWPLERYEEAVRAGLRADEARARSALVAPEALRALLPRLERGPMGLPPVDADPAFDEAVVALRATGEDDRRIAARLLAWLGTNDSPWSGYPAEENVPLVLLRRLDEDAVLAALLEAEDDASLLGAARHAADFHMVSFRKRFVGAIPDARFDAFEARLERVPMLPDEKDDARSRLERARAVARDVRDRARRTPDATSDFACVATSEDGPFAGLATDGTTIAALDVYRVVRVEPDTGVLSPLTTYQGSPFTELVFSGGALYAIRGNEGRIDRIALDGTGRTVVAEGLERPLDPIDAGGRPVWVAAPFENRESNGTVVSVERTSIVALGEGGAIETWTGVERGVASLASDGSFVYFLTTDPLGRHVVMRIPRGGGPIEKLASVDGYGDPMGRPWLVCEGSDLLLASGQRILRIPAAGGRATTAHTLDRKVVAIGTLPEGLVALAGDGGDDRWDVLRLRVGERPRKLGTLSRAPYHRVRLVSARGSVFFTLGDRLHRVR